MAFAKALASTALVSTLAVVALATPASADPSADGSTTRITSAGGINIVPTPQGLDLQMSRNNEATTSSCSIGAGCAARTWVRLVGANPNDPDQIVTFQSNVGVLPTTRLAKRNMRALKQRFQTFRANSGFVGDIKQQTTRGIKILTINGYFDQTVDDYVRIAQLRQGRKTVFIELNLDNRLTTTPLPKRPTTTKLVKRGKAALRQSWAQVPTTVLP